MSSIEYILPLDQPLGQKRLLSELRSSLASADFTQLSFVVAYAKSGPLLRLRQEFQAWKSAGKTARAIFGLDQQGTSRQALEFALEHFDYVYVTQEKGITFHPKFYLFEGDTRARLAIGSNNLTVGGTETNFESAVLITCNLPADNNDLDPIRAAWNALLPANCPATTHLDAPHLAALVANGTVLDEAAMPKRANAAAGDHPNQRSTAAKSGLPIRPASPIPRGIMVAAAAAGQAPQPAVGLINLPPPPPVRAQRFAIQIRPHPNGEIFLSVTAALQDPAFFNWPFNGQTIPKKAGNPSYPQLDPDPVVNITVWGAAVIPVLSLVGYDLNTVYYARNSEIRITAAPLVSVVPEYSVMVMQKSVVPTSDYDIDIYRPDSPDYAAWLGACNQTMPGGGRPPRKFGWF